MSGTPSDTLLARPSLTTHLQSLSTPRPYAAAVEHAFLKAAGERTLSPALLSLYLSQDKIYAAHAYPRFIGRLIAAIPFSSLSADNSAAAEAFHTRVLKTLSYALSNVVREVELFGEFAGGSGAKALWAERKATRDYTAEMARVGVEGSFEEMLVFLWAMERVWCRWCSLRALTNKRVIGRCISMRGRTLHL